MLTIHTMVRFGPWLLLRVEDLTLNTANWQRCERCGERIRYVYVCKVDGEAKEWRIGSTCGPTLIAVSDWLWTEAAQAAARNLMLLHRTLRLKAWEQGLNPWGSHLGVDWLDRFINCLIACETGKHYLAGGNHRLIGK